MRRGLLTSGLSLWMTLVPLGDQWHITWTPHPDNVILQVDTQCNGPGTEMFRAISRYDIGPEDSMATVHRVDVRGQSQCWVSAEVMRNPTDNPSPDYEYVGEFIGMGID